MKFNCPQCGGPLRKVSYPGGMLNEDQWMSQRAGDYYCTECKSDQARTGYMYFWRSMLSPVPDNSINYNELDPGIRETVRLLRTHGFKTTDSGDGVSKVDGLSFPHVAMLVTEGEMVREAKRLLKLLRQRGLSFEPHNSGDFPTIEVSYNPVDGHCVLFLASINDKLLGLGKPS